MGLDAFELVLEVETAFDLRLNERNLEETRTVGQFYDLIRRSVEARRSSHPCLTQTAFYRVRRALMDLAGVDRAAVRPGVPLATLLLPNRRRAFWSSFERDMGLRLPALESIWSEPLSLWWAGCCVLAIVLVVVGAVAALLWDRDSWLYLGLGWSLVCLAAVVAMWVTPRRRFGPEFETVGGLARCVIGENLAQFAAPAPDAEGVLWQRLCAIISEHLGVDAKTLRRETNFVRDLGV